MLLPHKPQLKSENEIMSIFWEKLRHKETKQFAGDLKSKVEKWTAMPIKASQAGHKKWIFWYCFITALNFELFHSLTTRRFQVCSFQVPKTPLLFRSLSCNSSLSYQKANKLKLRGELTVWSTSFPFCLLSVLYYKLQAFTADAELSEFSGRACLLCSTVREQGAFRLEPRRLGPGDSSARPTTAQQVLIDQLICCKERTVSPKLSTIASRPPGWLLTHWAVSVQEAYKWVCDEGWWSGGAVVMHGGAVTVSDNPLMREGSLCKTSCSLGGVHLLATTLELEDSMLTWCILCLMGKA